ncbi:sensor histidine kinase [Noviherbaspirillum sedimenti]|uniref:Histidine kinase n=1 Tax=Noviherbaspirillum sedimenti TaxID=2320865 RepID=A0A3A3FXT3_9BURK|nr:histidine kinase [Noviherbaspirillum sedimenti]RJG00524.1 histidine kinase [Noviherbaspirillum sedimenti]
MPATSAASPPIEIVIPDCCNIGVVFRALVAVNAAFLAGILLQTSGWQAGLSKFIETSTLIELASLLSLMALCGVRKLIRSMPLWLQRALCALVPAAIASLLIRLLSTSVLFLDALDGLHPAEAALAAALIGIALQHYFELRTRAFSPALAEARLQALQARIRPHFLFNSLNAVLSLIRTEPLRAETTLEDLAELFRVLMRDARDMTTLEQEIRLCRQYLSIEKVRLGERLHVKWNPVDISKEVLQRAQIPALLLQPLLENAVHYGVEPASDAALIQIDIRRQIDRIEIAIVNPYHGDAAAPCGNQMALTNIRQRLALLYDVEAQLSTSVERGLFEVRLRFPYVKTRKDR